MSAGFVRMHDGWALDPRMQWLLRRDRDAVLLFWELICQAHRQDSDGFVTREEALNVAEVLHLPDGNRALRALRRAGLVLNVGRTAYEVRTYGKWQTTSDQRRDHAERMRTSRARAKPRDSREREIERERARARTHAPQPADDAGIVRLRESAEATIRRLQEGDRE